MYDTTSRTIACCCSFPRKHERTYYIHSVQAKWRYTDSGLAEPRINYSKH